MKAVFTRGSPLNPLKEKTLEGGIRKTHCENEKNTIFNVKSTRRATPEVHQWEIP